MLGKRIPVTGGAGVFGSHPVGRLPDRGDDVLHIDDFYTGTWRRNERLTGHRRFEPTRYGMCFPGVVAGGGPW
jgi:nucleoside-diphosphate-sugar epimerase